MITALDHIAVVVNDLDQAAAAYTALLGREPNWRGSGGGAHHVWFQLDNMALDVIAADGSEGAMGERVRAHLAEHGESLWALAFAVDDMAAHHRAVERRGVRFSTPGPVRSTAADGAKRYWETAASHPADSAGVNLFLIGPPRDPAPWPKSPPTVSEAAAVGALDHVVVRTPDAERAAALYGTRLGLDLRLDRSNPKFGSRLMFFRAGDAVVEIGAPLDRKVEAGPDTLSGLAWRVADPHAAQARLAAAGVDVSEVRDGRKPGTQVFTVRSGAPAAPFLMIKPSVSEAD